MRIFFSFRMINEKATKYKINKQRFFKARNESKMVGIGKVFVISFSVQSISRA
jgi:hypothetical protein